MSIALLNYVFDRSEARGSERLVLLVLADRADDLGRCWPGVADIARRSRLSQRQTRRLIERLRTAGELIIEQAGGGTRTSGAGRTNRYIVVAGREHLNHPVPPKGTLSSMSAYVPDNNHGNPVPDGSKPGRERPSALTLPTNKGVTRDRGTINESSVNRQIEPTEEREPILSTADAAVSRIEKARQQTRTNGPARVRYLLSTEQSTPASRRQNSCDPHTTIICLMADRGCDLKFRNAAARFADVRVVRSLAAEFDNSKDYIENPGGWWRSRLRDAGTPNI